MSEVRQHRVAAFCDWLDTIKPQPPFHTRPEFRFYSDLSDAEIEAASQEMRTRGADRMDEGAALERFQTIRNHHDLHSLAVELGSPDDWAWSAIVYLKGAVGAQTDGPIEVSACAIHLALGYLERIAEQLGIIGTPKVADGDEPGPQAA